MKFETSEKAIGEALSNVTGELSKSVGTTLSDVWYLVFGGISHLAEKRKLKYANDLDVFKKELETKIEAIPEERRIEPGLQVAAPALEKARYCVEEPILREMFANLIASSCDEATFREVQPSFAEIISQMTPLDAQNIALFRKVDGNLPVASYRVHFNKGGFSVLLDNVFLSNPTNIPIERQALSLSSLQRLGLITINYGTYLTDETKYDVFENDLTFQMYKTTLPLTSPEIKEVKFQKGLVSLTPLGKAFLKVCFTAQKQNEEE